MYIDLALEIPSSPKLISTASVNPNSFVNKYKKISPEKKNKSNNDNSNFTIISKYRSLVHVGFVKNKQLVKSYHYYYYYYYYCYYFIPSRFPLSHVFR